MFEDFEGQYGTVNTKWERLWDDASYAQYWYHWESGATEWTRYAGPGTAAANQQTLTRSHPRPSQTRLIHDRRPAICC